MKIKKLLFCSLFLFLLGGCNNQSSIVDSPYFPLGPSNPFTHPTTTIASPRPVYAGYFRILNSGNYKALLSACRRCGEKRLIRGPFGGVTYQRTWTLGENPKSCNNWLGQGFLQIEFEADQLPTTAKVLIQPKYSGHLGSYSVTGERQEVWGEAFEVSATAHPTNENEGFEIIINPSQGIEGTYNLIIASESSNHVHNSDLPITASYGVNDQALFTQTLKKYQQRWQKTPRYSCSQYTN